MVARGVSNVSSLINNSANHSDARLYWIHPQKDKCNLQRPGTQIDSRRIVLNTKPEVTLFFFTNPEISTFGAKNPRQSTRSAARFTRHSTFPITSVKF